MRMVQRLLSQLVASLTLPCLDPILLRDQELGTQNEQCMCAVTHTQLVGLVYHYSLWGSALA